jgi:hypothetical protein
LGYYGLIGLFEPERLLRLEDAALVAVILGDFMSSKDEMVKNMPHLLAGNRAFLRRLHLDSTLI